MHHFDFQAAATAQDRRARPALCFFARCKMYKNLRGVGGGGGGDGGGS